MVSVIHLVDQLEIPAGIKSLADFRRWSRSSQFPEKGRIDFIQGRIEVDMSPEAYFSHGTLKTEFVYALMSLNKPKSLGDVLSDCTRIVSVPADLSAEPDVVFISHQSLDTGRVKLVPRPSDEDEFIEVEGAPDVVVEIVSDSSVAKDTKRLLRAYFEAGIPEYWLVDARGRKLLFRIYRRGKSGYVATKLDADGYQRSKIFDKRFRLDRTKPAPARWKYDLQMKP